MRENFFTLCANSARKLLIPRERNFQFMREPTRFVGSVTGSITWNSRTFDEGWIVPA